MFLYIYDNLIRKPLSLIIMIHIRLNFINVLHYIELTDWHSLKSTQRLSYSRPQGRLSSDWPLARPRDHRDWAHQGEIRLKAIPKG